MKTIPSVLKILLILGLLYSAITVEAQQTEALFLHIDRDKYIAGEEIWFSIYLTDCNKRTLSSLSLLTYVELLNPWNRPVSQTRIRIYEGRGEGNFTLPDSISSGTYTVRAYTNRMKDYLPDNCFMQDIEVVNPFGNEEFRRKMAQGQIMNSMRTNGGSVISLIADTIFGRREKVIIKLGNSSGNREQISDYQMSISVAPAELNTSLHDIKEFLPDFQARQLQLSYGNNNPSKYNYESNGHFLSGKVRYRQSNVSDSSGYLFMSTQGKVAEFRYAETDSNGRFTFILPVDDKQRNLILQPQFTDNNMILEIEPSFSWSLPSSRSFNETLSGSDLDLFSELSFNYQTAKIYGINPYKEPEVKDESNLKKRRFYGIPEMEIILDDYIKLPTMQEVFYELVTGVIIRQRKSGYDMRITNPLTGVYYDDSPLVMIDGVIINDLAVLMNLDPETVEKVEVVKTPYLIGDLILHGIVNIITAAGNFSNITMPEYAVILPYRVVDTPNVISLPDYSDEKTRLSRKPDFRNTLYWNPSARTDKNGHAEISFWTSDLPGTYTISIQAISGTGELISIHKSFRVR
ncbi:MAG: hypothetical protein IPH69_16655 [Bacteroidales bacterium]|nr:hypothetical protein [Bacteroidales bacterium]